MYRYDEIDATIVNERVAQFRDQTRRFLDGKLSEDEFRPLRLRNGLYIQKHAPMLRVAIPYGLLSTRQLRMLGHLARKYDRDYGHFTTRQNIQYNWPELKDVPDMLADLASVEMHAIQTSGNCIRNVTADHFAGIAPDELEDPRPYCEIIRQWSTLHPEFTYLPRKFKIAVTGSPADRAASEVHDIGLHMRRDASGAVGFEVLVGGGLGRTPIIGKVIREFLPREHLLSYLEAILRVYNQEGRRDNIYKARIKILVKAKGVEDFRKAVEAEWELIRDSALKLEQAEIDRVAAFFRPLPYEKLADINVTQGQSADFQAWYRYNTRPHKIPGYCAVIVSLKAHGEAPGDITADTMDSLADLADRVSSGEVRATHDQNLVLGEVRQMDLIETWQTLKALNLATPNIGTLTDMICCPGLDFCSLANAGSIGIAKQIQERFSDFDYLYDLGHIEIKMSGCMNACGHHHVGHIGILGVDKHGIEWYQITLGGSVSGTSSLGEVIGPSVGKEVVAETIARILDVYVEKREEGEEFLATVRRIGVEPFAERVYAQLIKGRDVVANPWVLAGTEGAAGATHLILPLADYIKAIAAGEPANLRAPLLKAADHDVSPLLPYLPKVPLVAVDFTSTGDGRGYTQARLLRERHGYKGELRAVGKIRADQMFFMARCGFDAFDLLDDEDVAVAIAQLDRFSVAYQPGSDGLTHPRRRYGM